MNALAFWVFGGLVLELELPLPVEPPLPVELPLPVVFPVVFVIIRGQSLTHKYQNYRHSANKLLHLVSEHVGITFKHSKSQSVTNEELFTVLEPTAPCDDSRVRQCIVDRQTDRQTQA